MATRIALLWPIFRPMLIEDKLSPEITRIIYNRTAWENSFDARVNVSIRVGRRMYIVSLHARVYLSFL